MPIVEIQGIGEVIFPDTMREEDILKAIQEDILPSYRPELPAYTPPPPPEPKQSALRQVADVPLKIGSGVVQGVRFITDAFGADNPVSQNLRGMEDYIAELYSAQSKADSAKIAEIMQEAEDKGLGAQLRAAVEAFATAPVDFLSQALGTAAPTIAAGMVGTVARLGAMGVRGAQLATGAAMGAGVTKSSIYDAVEQALLESNVPPEEAARRASAAQEYTSKNAGLIAAGTGLGALSGITGLEPQVIRGLLGGAAREAGKSAVEIAEKGALRRAGETAAKEAIPETVQGAQEQYAQNIALQREGFDVPTMRGVYGAGALEGMAGAGLGAGVGAISQDPGTIQRHQREAETAAKLREINAERARQDQIVAEAQAAAPALEERTADLAGFAAANEEYAAAVDRTNKTRAMLEARFPEGKLAEVFGNDLEKLDDLDGIKEVEQNFNKYFKVPADEAKAIKRELKQHEQALRKVNAETKKLAPEMQARAKLLETEQKAYETLGVTSFAELERRPLPELIKALDDLSITQAGTTRKGDIPRLDRVQQLLEKAIENQQKLFNQQPPHPETLERIAALPAETINSLVDEGVIPPEIGARGLQYREAAEFELQPQDVEPTQPQTQEVMKGEQYEAAPAGQKRLFTKSGKPTAAAVRGQSLPRAEVAPEDGGVDGQRGVRGMAVPDVPVETPDAEVEGAGQRGLGTTAGPSEGGGVRRGGGSNVEPIALTEEQAEVIAARQHAAKMQAEALEMESEPEPTTREEAQKRAERDVEEALRAEQEGYDPDEWLYSKPSKAKRKAAAGKPPKQVPSLEPLNTDKPSSVEAVEKAVERLFNPVWLKQARAQGWLHIVSGKPSDVAALANANVDNAQGVYMGRKGHVYIFPDNIPQGGERGVILHEIGEHKGLEEMIGAANVTRLANRVRTMAQGSDRDAEIAKRALQRAEESGTVDDKEVVAYFTEVAVNEAKIEPGGKKKPAFGKAVQWINDLWNSIKKAMVKLHVNPDTLNSQDLVDIVYGAARLQMGKEGGTTETDTSSETTSEEEPEILRQSVPRNPIYELTPEERAAREAKGLTVFATPQKQTMKEAILDAMGLSGTYRSWLDKLGNAVVGPLFTLQRKASAYYGPENFYSKTSGKLLGSLMAQHALNANNLTFDALKNGTMEIDDRGFVSTVDTDDNIRTLMGDYNALMDAMIADGISPAEAYQNASLMILAPRYKALIKMGIKSKEEFSSASMAEAARLQEKYKPQYTAWRDRYNRMRKNKRQFLIDSGLMSAKRADELLDKLEYVPLYRIKDSEGMDGVFMQNLLGARGEQKLQFDTKDYDVSDVMGNIAKNEMWLYKRAIYNHTINLTTDQIEEMGGGRHLKVRPKDAEHVITYMRNGEVAHFKFDDPNDMALFMSVPVINNAVVRMMTRFGQLLRKSITLTPSFVYRQVWQDVERAWMQAGNKQGFIPMLGTSIREQAKNFRKYDETDTAKALRKRGVVGAVEYQDSFDNALDELLGRDPRTPMEKFYKLVERAEKMAQNSDLAARAIVYEGALKEGFSEGEAALRAQMMLNYQHRGISPALRTLLSTIPFINTKIQGEWRLYEALQGKIPGLPKEKARVLLASKIAKLMLFTTAYAMLRMDEDDYERESDETRNRNFLFNVGGAPLKIPVAPEYLVPKVVAEKVVRQAFDAEFETDRKTAHAVKTAFAELLLSPSDSLPSVIRPLIENITNYSFFGDRALVGVTLLERDVNQQYIKGQTSELAKFISDQLHAIGGDPLAVSPIKIDNLINGLFGTFGRDVIWATNQLDAAITGEERPDLLLRQLPEVGAAFYNPEGSQRIADFYDLRERVMKRYNTYLDLRKNRPDDAKAYMEKNKKYLQLRPQISAMQRQLDAIRAQRNRVLESKTMSGEEKREKLNALLDRTNRVLGTRVQELTRRLED